MDDEKTTPAGPALLPARPAMHGYVRRLPGWGDGETERASEALGRFAHAHGFSLGRVFVEDRPGQRLAVWDELITSCGRDRVRDVAVPAMEHFHASPELAAFMCDELSGAVRGQVWLADPAGRPEGTAPQHSSTVALPARTEAVPRARHHTRRMLADWEVPEEHIDSTELAVAELVTNTVRHVAAQAPESEPQRWVSLSLHRAAAHLVVEVADGDTRPPVAKGLPAWDAEGGRGLFIVEALAQDWGHHHPPTGGKVVWCRLPLPAGSEAGAGAGAGAG